MSDDPRLPFALVPIEAFFDARLTLVQLRVLGALLSFRNRSTGLIFPSREAISARTGLPITRVSTATSALVTLGWLTKEGKGGKTCTYSVNTPFDVTEALLRSLENHPTVTESVTVTDPVTVTESVTPTVTESVTDTVTESVTGNRQDNRPVNRQRTNKGAARESTKRSGFVVPTIDEVRAHVHEHGYTFDPEAFVAHYTSNGWMVGKTKMVSWKSACVTWQKRRNEEPRTAKHGRTQSPISSENFSGKTYATTDTSTIDWLSQ